MRRSRKPLSGIVGPGVRIPPFPQVLKSLKRKESSLKVECGPDRSGKTVVRRLLQDESLISKKIYPALAGSIRLGEPPFPQVLKSLKRKESSLKG
jgi:hypothetical protein